MVSCDRTCASDVLSPALYFVKSADTAAREDDSLERPVRPKRHDNAKIVVAENDALASLKFLCEILEEQWPALMQEMFALAVGFLFQFRSGGDGSPRSGRGGGDRGRPSFCLRLSKICTAAMSCKLPSAIVSSTQTSTTRSCRRPPCRPASDRDAGKAQNATAPDLPSATSRPSLSFRSARQPAAPENHCRTRRCAGSRDCGRR